MALVAKLIGGLGAAFLLAWALNLLMLRFGPWANPPWFTEIWVALSMIAVSLILWRHYRRGTSHGLARP